MTLAFILNLGERPTVLGTSHEPEADGVASSANQKRERRRAMSLAVNDDLEVCFSIDMPKPQAKKK